MLQLTVAGRLGRDAEHRTTQNGKDVCNFAVAADVGYGDNKQTYWVDVSRWGAGAKGLANILTKGTAVAVTGELTTREHNGKTYLQCRADTVTLLGGGGERKQSYSDSPPADSGQGGDSNYDDLDDGIPF